MVRVFCCLCFLFPSQGLPRSTSSCGHQQKQGVALALETHVAAQLINKSPTRVRGGPWTFKELTKPDLQEIAGAASCKSLTELWTYAEGLGASSKLWKHLRNLKMDPLQRPVPKVASRPVPSRVLDVSIRVPKIDAKLARRRSGTKMSGQSRSGAEMRFEKLPKTKQASFQGPTV